MSLAETLQLPSLSGDLARVGDELRESVRSTDPLLDDVASHLVNAGGKRIRPTLTLGATYAATGGNGPASARAITGATAVELVHLGSLYHDDVIDESETRRGVPSVNARWSNIVAILAGDFLLARASSLAASLGAEVASLLAATIAHLCQGQVLELQHVFDISRTEGDYEAAIEGKTAALFATSCRIGGMVAEVDEPTLDALTRYGHHLGLCFQIVDDVLDLTADRQALGKPVGQDLVEGIYTLPVIYALKDSPALRELLGGPLDPGGIAQARELSTANGTVDAALAVARDHSKKAIEALAGADGLDAEVCDRLTRFVTDLITRES